VNSNEPHDPVPGTEAAAGGAANEPQGTAEGTLGDLLQKQLESLLPNGMAFSRSG